MTKTLHLVQAGVQNGDKAWLEKAASRGLVSPPYWVVPKAAAIGDEVVFFIGGFGFFATGQITSAPKPRRNWGKRYGSAVGNIRLVWPAISLATIRQRIPDLTWAVYPRSITTPPPEVAHQVRSLVTERRRTRMPDLSLEALAGANIDELRRVALLRAVPQARTRQAVRVERARSAAIRLYVLCRANGRCEACLNEAPFKRANGSPYLEPHHVTRLADDGPDHPARVIGLCPNCHCRAHHASDAEKFNRSLLKRLRQIETAG
ncbi:MAG: hypothetical protein AB7H96_09475 [Vicinamibacterales bacterium]